MTLDEVTILSLARAILEAAFKLAGPMRKFTKLEFPLCVKYKTL